MGKRQSASNWIFYNADSVFNEHFLHLEVDMLKVEFVDGTEEEIGEIEQEESLTFIESASLFCVRVTDGAIYYPRDFVKSIRYIEV